MSLVNYSTREITCKIVYYGPGRSGKTTNLHYIYGQVPEDRKGKMVSLATQTDRTLFFDFLPLDLGTISGFTTKFQLYTVPGQVYYQTTRLNFHQQIIFPGALEDPTVSDPSLRYITVEKLSHTNGETVAGFGQAIWKPIPTVEITAGARYTHETKDSVFNQPYVVSLYQGVFRQNAPIGGMAAPRDCEHEIVWGFIAPFGKSHRLL